VKVGGCRRAAPWLIDSTPSQYAAQLHHCRGRGTNDRSHDSNATSGASIHVRGPLHAAGAEREAYHHHQHQSARETRRGPGTLARLCLPFVTNDIVIGWQVAITGPHRALDGSTFTGGQRCLWAC